MATSNCREERATSQMTGTLINMTTVFIGSLVGTLIGSRLPDKIHQTVIHGIGLMTLVVGMQMALKTHNILIPLFSVLLGGILGEWWHFDNSLKQFGRWLEEHVGNYIGTKDERSLTRAFVTASLVFCIGPLTILGAIQDGLTGDYTLLAIKSLLDGFTSFAFAASLGPGVILSLITILIFQGGISVLAMAVGSGLGNVTPETLWVVEMTATGGVLILGLGLLLLELKEIRVANLLPSVFLAPLIVVLLQALHISF